MNINWKVRLKNPVWWAGIAAAIVLPMLATMGLEWSDMTSWEPGSPVCVCWSGGWLPSAEKRICDC